MKEVQSLGDIRFGTLARSAEGLTQWRPLLLAFLTLLLTGAVMWLGQWLAVNVAAIMALIMMVLAFVVMMAGFSGVGIMLMDKAKEQPVRSFAAAASAGLLCLPKFLLIGLVMTLAFIAYMIVAAIIYFVCKIPFVGGVLAFIFHPILVLSFAAVLVALIWVVGPLMAPALWSGLPVKAAIANVLAIARKRLVEVVLMEVLLYIILSLITVLLFAGLVPASLTLTGLGVSLLGDSNRMMAMAMSGMGGGMTPMAMLGAGGNTWGLMGGLGVLYCVVGALLTQVAIMGMNLIYLQARGNLNPEEAEGALNDFMGDMRKKASEAKDLARQAAQDLAAKKDSSDTAQAVAPASYQPPQDQGQPSYGATYGATTGAAGVGSAAAAGLAAGSIHAAAPSADQTSHHEAMSREQALAAEKARIAAEEEAARQRTEAEVARVRAEAEAARQRADALAAEQAARERAAAEAEAAARARAEEQAAAERAAHAQAQAQAQAQIAAEEARRREQAEAAERAARERAEQERMDREKAEHERAQAAEQAARERAQAQAAAQAAEEARQREEAQAQARQRAEEQAREQARLQAEREAAEREAARVKAQAESEVKARLAAATPSCPSCHAHVSADDMFCGECGYKLK